MKKIFLLVAIIATAFTYPSFAQDTSKAGSAPQLLTYYYNIKNALVAGNANNASLAATAFVKAASIVDHNIIAESSINALVKDAAKIAATTDIKKQRESFAGFSTNMATLAKAVKLTDKPVYYAYCPMKKAYWLSSEKAIKNPYYGSAMLTCGEVTETIQ